MALRLTHGCAVFFAGLCLIAPIAQGSTTITTVAGGGAKSPAYYYESSRYVAPLDAYLPKPSGIAWSGNPDGLFYVLPGNSECVQLWMEGDPKSGDFGLNIEGGTFNDCSPSASAYPSHTPANQIKLKDACCVTSTLLWNDAFAGPYVASTKSARVEYYAWATNDGQTVAGT